tara:strand:+ start:80 stop:256 length:177 start_codon:yes stop_codon:yes gene_type:complete
MENAAFGDTPDEAHNEVTRILMEAMPDLWHPIARGRVFNLRDINGNHVGTARIMGGGD